MQINSGRFTEITNSIWSLGLLLPMTEAAVVGAVVGHAVHASAHLQPGACRGVDVPPGAAAVPGLHGAVVRGRRHRVEGPRLVRVPRVHRACGQRRRCCRYMRITRMREHLDSVMLLVGEGRWMGWVSVHTVFEQPETQSNLAL